VGKVVSLLLWLFAAIIFSLGLTQKLSDFITHHQPVVEVIY
jgi:hypothetical protein